MTEAIGGGYAVELWLSQDYAGGLQEDVEREVAAALDLAYERGNARVSVEMHEGFATLTGEVRGWVEKVAARRAVMRVPGVTGIDDSGVDVSPAAADARSDKDLARMACLVLDWDSRVPRGAVAVAVKDARVTLTGAVDHEDARAAALDAVARLVGVREVESHIVVSPRERPVHPSVRLQEELQRALGREARHVRVDLSEAGVQLTGRVSTLALRDAAARAVRRVLGDVRVSLSLR